MRVVVDTNIFVSSFFGGHPRSIIDLWTRGEIMLCLSPAIIDEYMAVLKRLGLEGEPEFGELMDLFARGYHVLFASETPTLKIVVADPTDDKFIECAVALKAGAIVTGDKALKNIKKYMGIAIFSPREFLNQFRR